MNEEKSATGTEGSEERGLAIMFHREDEGTTKGPLLTSFFFTNRRGHLWAEHRHRSETISIDGLPELFITADYSVKDEVVTIMILQSERNLFTFSCHGAANNFTSLRLSPLVSLGIFIIRNAKR
jgi:hypothetical protein